jgi:hypothetical protein
MAIQIKKIIGQLFERSLSICEEIGPIGNFIELLSYKFLAPFSLPREILTNGFGLDLM